MKFAAKVLRVLGEDDGKMQRTVIALGPADGAPPFTGAITIGVGQATISGAFAAIEIDQADVPRFKGGTSVTVTLSGD